MFTRHQALIAGLVALLGLSAAACASAPPPSSAMRLGAFTAAPDGFVDFCRRQPRECGVAEAYISAAAPAVEVAVAAPDQAMAASAVAQEAAPDWAAIFAAMDAAPVKAPGPPAPVAEAPLLVLASASWTLSTGAVGVEPRFDRSRMFDRAQIAPPEPAAEAVEPPVPVSPAVEPLMVVAQPAKAYALDAALWARLNRVNARINRAIIRSTDAAAYGVEELWSLPLENGQKYGDCEDYVLEKRLALIAEGVPKDALSIAVVQTAQGEGHAVLVVATDKGDYVLDNQTPWILPWTETHYRWVARQTALGPYSWALIATS